MSKIQIAKSYDWNVESGDLTCQTTGETMIGSDNECCSDDCFLWQKSNVRHLTWPRGGVSPKQ
jgi:hypothetical protein